MSIVCPLCSSDELTVVPGQGGGRRVTCEDCGYAWVSAVDGDDARRGPSPKELRGRFPSAGDVDPAARARAEQLKRDFLHRRPLPQPEVAEYWARYQRIFSPQGLLAADPQALKDFANSNVGANPGNMSVFNTAWNETGPEAGAERVREVVRHLLHGPVDVPVEDRLTDLVEGHRGLGMTGFREALLTKVLCIVEPDRFIPIVKYTGLAGKREIAEAVYGLELPQPERVSWTIGRLVLWSNDLLRELVGDGFADMQHAAQFLWWAKDQGGSSAPIPVDAGMFRPLG